MSETTLKTTVNNFFPSLNEIDNNYYPNNQKNIKYNNIPNINEINPIKPAVKRLYK